MITQEAVSSAVQRVGLVPHSIVIRRLDRPVPPIEIEPNLPLYPASMIKTPLALATLALAADGELRLDAVFEVDPGNMTANDKRSPLLPGYRSPLSEILELAITRSDNVATNMLFDIVGRERATSIVRTRFGLAHTAFHRKLSGSEPLLRDPQWDGVHRNAHTAADAALLFELIARDGVPFALRLREMLGRQECNEKLSTGLYPGDRFAHKTGSTDEVTHDGGILDTDSGGAYAIVVYSGLEASDANDARFGPFMSEIRPML